MEISKEELYDYYITQNHSRLETAEHFNIDERKLKDILSKNNIKKPRELFYKNALNSIRNRSIDDRKKSHNKMKETCLKRYGVDNPAKAQIVKDKYYKTISSRDKDIDLDSIIKDYLFNNLTLKEISIKYNISLNHVGYLLSKNGIHKDRKKIQECITRILRDKYGGGAISYKNKVIELSCKEEFIEYLKSFDRKPHIIEVANSLNVSYTTTRNYIKNIYKVEELVSKDTSRFEDIIKDILDKYHINYIQRDRNVIKPLELDLYLPEFNLAIEVNDNATHNDLSKERNYHYNKTKLAKEKGIHLVHIFEYEILDTFKYNKIEKYLKSLLNIDTSVIYARNCIIKEVNSKKAKEFLDEYHLQSYSSSSINLGLYYDDELVEIMTFGKPRFNKNYKYELIRLCTKSNYKVIGGSQKLFKYFINKYNPESIISYCDISKFVGSVYTKLNFTLEYTSAPNYVWVKGVEVLPRYKTQRSKLDLLFNKSYDKSMSESEIMRLEGYVKIYDCGNDVYTYNRI